MRRTKKYNIFENYDWFQTPTRISVNLSNSDSFYTENIIVIKW
jgi:hypothetical protein